jgi:large subunit ribosomal protein L30
MTTEKKVKVQLIKSPIGTRESHRATVRGLGLRGINSTSELEDTPAVRGMINKIAYLVKIV